MNLLVLHNVSFNVRSHGDGIDLGEIQSGYLLPTVETPLRKKRMAGKMLAKNSPNFTSVASIFYVLNLEINIYVLQVLIKCVDLTV